MNTMTLVVPRRCDCQRNCTPPVRIRPTSDQLCPDGVRDDVGVRVESGLLQDAAAIRADRLYAEVEIFGDDGGADAAGQETEDLELAIGEAFVRLCRAGGHAGGDLAGELAGEIAP